MDPFTQELIASGIIALGELFSSAFQPTPQERTSFEGSPVNPVGMLTNAMGQLGDVFGGVQQRAAGPVRLRSAYAQTPRGLTAQDPALSDPSMLQLPGIPFPSLQQRPQRMAPGSQRGGGGGRSGGRLSQPAMAAIQLLRQSQRAGG